MPLICQGTTHARSRGSAFVLPSWSMSSERKWSCFRLVSALTRLLCLCEYCCTSGLQRKRLAPQTVKRPQPLSSWQIFCSLFILLSYPQCSSQDQYASALPSRLCGDSLRSSHPSARCCQEKRMPDRCFIYARRCQSGVHKRQACTRPHT